jgi:N-acetylmuramoyl-L-alanine amidase
MLEHLRKFDYFLAKAELPRLAPGRRKCSFLPIFFVLLSAGALAPWQTWAVAGGESAPVKTVVVIDPGHGGGDVGLKLSGSGFSEKEFTLKVAQELKNLLTRKPGLTVWLTRSQDQAESLNARQSFTNAKNAGIFLSLHACENGFPHPEVFVFTHQVKSDETLKELSARAQDGGVSALPWDLAQAPVKAQSRALAKALAKAWEVPAAGVQAVHVQEIPLGVLAGVKAPAVLVEMPLPNAAGAKAQETACKLAAKILAAGIRDFLERR